MMAYLKDAYCFKCNQGFKYTRYQSPPQCPYCEKKKKESIRIMNKCRRNNPPIQRNIRKVI